MCFFFRMEHLLVVKFFMIISGTWRIPLNTHSRTKQNLYNIFSATTQIYLCVFVLCLFIELPLIWNEDVNKVTENIGITILCIMIFIKNVICQQKKVRDIFVYILETEKGLNDFESENLEVYRSNAVYTKNISIFLSVYSSMCGITLVLTKFYVYIQLKNAAARNHMNQTYIEPPLPYVVWRPVDEKKHYISAFFIDSISATIGCTFNTTTQLIFISVMTFLIGQLKILQNRFRNFGQALQEKMTTTELSGKLRLLIIHHKRIIT
ncbi:uncharacterized protein [Leptinotarsa decemlineata]|uniref:uncharacterized protein n=1 Tax=Leptinotarsa decemlineata TaxID=7539 RepID=UPI003D305DC3